MKPIILLNGEHSIRDRLVTDIDQMLIDNVAEAIHLNAPASTKNRQIYTPISAVLKRAGVESKVFRPRGHEGNSSTSWLEPPQAFRLIDEAYKLDEEFGLLCVLLLYTGMRRGEPLRCFVRDLKIDRAMLYVPNTKNGDPRPVHLPPVVVDAFLHKKPRKLKRRRKGQPPRFPVRWLYRPSDERLFRFHVSSFLNGLLKTAMKNAGLTFPARQGGFHIFCHTYGSWMSYYGKLDTEGLTRTNRWKNQKSAARYKHTMTTPEAQQSNTLPTYSRKTRLISRKTRVIRLPKRKPQQNQTEHPPW